MCEVFNVYDCVVWRKHWSGSELHIAAVSKLVCVIGLDYMCSACSDAVRMYRQLVTSDSRQQTVHYQMSINRFIWLVNVSY